MQSVGTFYGYVNVCSIICFVAQLLHGYINFTSVVNCTGLDINGI